jgi:hypothetical protein
MWAVRLSDALKFRGGYLMVKLGVKRSASISTREAVLRFAAALPFPSAIRWARSPNSVLSTV